MDNIKQKLAAPAASGGVSWIVWGPIAGLLIVLLFFGLGMLLGKR